MHSDAEPGSRLAEDQAHRFASELLMPATQMHDLLPTAMGGNVWTNLAQLKEEWGVSLQALLYCARRLGRLSDVSYRNAMIRISEWGWRRNEPGLVTTIEQPSLLPRAVELLAESGTSEADLLSQCRLPSGLFRIATARRPEEPTATTLGPGDHTSIAERGASVVSLLDKRANLR